ncbi:MAG: hypothetical protein ACLTCI_02310 [[Clostridium] nexile]
MKESKEESEDPFVRQLQKTIEKIKVNREMGERFMVFQEMLSEERAVGRNEGKQEMQKETIVSCWANSEVYQIFCGSD